jgi:Gas vesicle protein
MSAVPDPTVTARPAAEDHHSLASREIALVDLLDRVLARGVVLTGDLTLAIADIDLVHISLRALITSIKDEGSAGWDPISNDDPSAPRMSEQS